MSMSRACEIFEFEPNKWYCVVAQDEHDWDFKKWTCYGPKSTEDEAFELMSDYECNPGSSWSCPYDRMTPEMKKSYKRFVDKAKSGRSSGRYYF